jgi:hypothetical protein
MLVRTSPKNHTQILSIDPSLFCAIFFEYDDARDTSANVRAPPRPALGGISAQHPLSARKVHASPCGSSSASAPRSEDRHGLTVPTNSDDGLDTNRKGRVSQISALVSSLVFRSKRENSSSGELQW